MKKLFSLLLAACLFFSLAACAGAETDNGGAATASPSAAAATDSGSTEETKEPVTLEVNIVQTDWSDSWDVMEARFEEQYDYIDLVSVGVGEDGNKFITQRAAANDLPAVIQLDNAVTYRNLCDEGKIVDLADRPVAANIPQSYLDAFTYNDTVMGITQGAAFSVLYINMDILNAAGWNAAPTNWDEFIQCCKDIDTKTDAAPLTLAGDKTTTCWMLYELILANVCGDTLGFGTYEEQFMNGTFDFTAYPDATAKLQEVAGYMLTGTSNMTEDDVTAAMADGSAAMAVAGNWTANNICTAIEENTGKAESAVAILAPFNAAGASAWISVSPETSFALTVQEDENVAAAAELFFDWVFQPENFAIIQNARGTVPVLTNMTEDQIKLPAPISAIVADMNAANYFKMGFNLWTEEFRDSACTALKDVYSGNKTAEEAVSGMWTLLQTSNLSKG